MVYCRKSCRCGRERRAAGRGRGEAGGGCPPAAGAAPAAGALGIACRAPRSRGSPWQMPQLSARHLRGREELHLAHLVLSFITMGYLWQEGEEGTVKVLPQNLAVPFWEVSQALGLPPILCHADFVLANWRRKDPDGNLDTIISLPGAESLRGFILVTLLVEKAAVPGIKVGGRCFAQSCQPRPLLAAPRYQPDCSVSLCSWKDNPAMPGGLVYEGVSDEPLAYSGGSAAQSTVLHAFDELLGIRGGEKRSAFLRRMRQYMPPPHRAFVEEIRRAPPLRQHVLSSGDARLRAAFNRCVCALADFRSYHITIVTKYIAVAAAKAKAGRAEPGDGPAAGKPPSALETKGTGGSHIFSFLKSVRDTTREGVISA
uniref:Indoleamine 2,3-dioxygenase 2 n=1 Tax=Athene cunicularia TaxID=194338 RepID=A0A663MJJ2_ATHCN